MFESPKTGIVVVHFYGLYYGSPYRTTRNLKGRIFQKNKILFHNYVF